MRNLKHTRANLKQTTLNRKHLFVLQEQTTIHGTQKQINHNEINRYPINSYIRCGFLHQSEVSQYNKPMLSMCTFERER